LEAVTDSVDTVKSCLQIVSVYLKDLRVNENKTLEAVTKDYLNAGELIDYLIQRDVSFKIAQNTVNEIVSYAARQGKNLDALSLEEFRRFSENIGDDVFYALSLEQSLTSKNQIGGTSPERVFEALELAKDNLEREKTDAA
jgi:argininosuccinate lyase